MPLAFNWESATFSVPALIGYLVPLHLAYTVQVLVTLAIAGTGVYVLGRLLGLGVLGCTMAATVYELSGSLFALVGWSFGAVMSWAGWLFVALILVIRGRHRVRAVTFFAVVVACVIYAGEPEGLVFMAITMVVFVVVVLGLRVRRSNGGPISRPPSTWPWREWPVPPWVHPSCSRGSRSGACRSARSGGASPRTPGRRRWPRRYHCTTSSASCSRVSTVSPCRGAGGSPIVSSTSTWPPTSG